MHSTKINFPASAIYASTNEMSFFNLPASPFPLLLTHSNMIKSFNINPDFYHNGGPTIWLMENNHLSHSPSLVPFWRATYSLSHMPINSPLNCLSISRHQRVIYISQLIYQYIFGIWKKVGAPGGNPHDLRNTELLPARCMGLILTMGDFCVEFVHSPCDHLSFLRMLWFFPIFQRRVDL